MAILEVLQSVFLLLACIVLPIKFAVTITRSRSMSGKQIVPGMTQFDLKQEKATRANSIFHPA